MVFKLSLLLSLAAFRIVLAEKAGYFEDLSVCADPKGLKACYEDADTRYASCINNSCDGGDSSCYKSCNGDTSCMTSQCPNLGVDCINVCECIKKDNEIDCMATSCWNQVYSCEYQKTGENLINYCPKVDLEQIPFWPPPENAPGGCSCNFAKIDLRITQISNYLTTCANNETNVEQLTVEEMSDYGRACICCSYSAAVSTIWDECPNTDPAILGADYWLGGLMEGEHGEACSTYMEHFPCKKLGFGDKVAGGTNTFYTPDNLPKNGTETLYNTGGVISSPVSGATFTWTSGTLEHAITVSSTDNVVTATVTGGSGGSGSSGSTATETGASATSSGLAVGLKMEQPRKSGDPRGQIVISASRQKPPEVHADTYTALAPHPYASKMTQTSSTLLALTMAGAGYLAALCTTPPNPSPSQKDRHSTDRITWIAGAGATIARRTTLTVTLYHALLTITPSYAPDRLHQICPRPENRNMAVFTWSPITLASLFVIFLGAFVRLSAFGGLGRNFTFHLAAPDQLVTSGVYRWMQHPSYTGQYLIYLGCMGVFLRWDGVASCYIGKDVLESLVGYGVPVGVGILVWSLTVLGLRVRDEEGMLREEFGEKWEVWHRKTPRFLPALF
ncbi:hypothetical protein N7448_009188 [Penicillium atrosanguineum]|nr:hypothetical protein N7448_009188 [Penicillium atrosanguineum]